MYIANGSQIKKPRKRVEYLRIMGVGYVQACLYLISRKELEQEMLGNSSED
jgi:hypothetical protein